jgi:3-phosphoshikimate 1-carboxyvinyltransferase
MELIVTPAFSLRGEVSLPGDKSLSHRAALLAALAKGESCIRNFLVAGVTEAMLRNLTALGVAWKLNGTTLLVVGKGLRGLRPPRQVLDCGNSATTMRLLAGALAGAGIPAVLDGSPGLRRRPMERIVQPLRAMGVPIQASGRGTAPLRLGSRSPDKPLRAIDYSLPVASAQVKSALLLAALAADGSTTLREPGPSRDHTERLLSSMGVSVICKPTSSISNAQTTIVLTPPRPLSLSPFHLTLPGDISSAAFLIAASLIVPGSEITLRGVGLNPTRTGLLDAFARMGADIRIHPRGERHNEPIGDLIVRYSPLRGTQISGELVVRMLDEIPAFAVAAAFAGGTTHVCQAGELRHKETDRIAALGKELRALGVDIEEKVDGFTLFGGKPVRGGMAYAHEDHRLAMALAIVGLAARNPVTVKGAGIIAESFPKFGEVLSAIGANVTMCGGAM